VFLRRVRSRILYEQMLGRATRRCDEINKEVFRIFDAVDLYSALEAFTSMKPIVPNPSIGFAELVQQLHKVNADNQAAQVVDEFVAKLQRKKRKLSQPSLEQFEAAAGMDPNALIRMLRNEGANVAQKWLIDHVALAEVIDRAKGTGAPPILISSTRTSCGRCAPATATTARPATTWRASANTCRVT